jgi:hypothetical protein
VLFSLVAPVWNQGEASASIDYSQGPCRGRMQQPSCGSWVIGRDIEGAAGQGRVIQGTDDIWEAGILGSDSSSSQGQTGRPRGRALGMELKERTQSRYG